MSTDIDLLNRKMEKACSEIEITKNRDRFGNEIIREGQLFPYNAKVQKKFKKVLNKYYGSSSVTRYVGDKKLDFSPYSGYSIQGKDDLPVVYKNALFEKLSK